MALRGPFKVVQQFKTKFHRNTCLLKYQRDYPPPTPPKKTLAKKLIKKENKKAKINQLLFKLYHFYLLIINLRNLIQVCVKKGASVFPKV